MFEVKPFHPDQLVFENGLHARRLLPFPGLNAPFEGSWCQIEPGSASTPHGHHEYEIFICMNGQGRIKDHLGEEKQFEPGDVAAFTPHHEHSIENVGSEPLLMYSIWWDRPMAEGFLHNDATTQEAP